MIRVVFLGHLVVIGVGVAIRAEVFGDFCGRHVLINKGQGNIKSWGRGYLC